MPHMMPMMWTLLFLFFCLNFTLNLSFIYFNYISFFLSKKMNKNKLFKWIWKW